MDRNEFLIALWKKRLKPTLLIGVLIFCVLFLYNAISENGDERLATLLILGLAVLFIVAKLVGLMIQAGLNQKEFSEALPRGLAEKFEKRQVFQVGM